MYTTRTHQTETRTQVEKTKNIYFKFVEALNARRKLEAVHVEAERRPPMLGWHDLAYAVDLGLGAYLGNVGEWIVELFLSGREHPGHFDSIKV